MTAIRVGVKAVDSSAETTKGFNDLVNIAQALNDSTPGLYAVFQAAKHAKTGKFELANKIISMCALYPADTLLSMEPMTVSREGSWTVRGFISPATMEKSDQNPQDSVFCASSESDIGDPNPQPSMNDMMRYRPSTPETTIHEDLQQQHGTSRLHFTTWIGVALSCLPSPWNGSVACIARPDSLSKNRS